MSPSSFYNQSSLLNTVTSFFFSLIILFFPFLSTNDDSSIIVSYALIDEKTINHAMQSNTNFISKTLSADN